MSTVCFISSDPDLPVKAPNRSEQGAVLSLCVHNIPGARQNSQEVDFLPVEGFMY